MTHPFDGTIPACFENAPPGRVRRAIFEAGSGPIPGADCPYDTPMARTAFAAQLQRLQSEPVKMQYRAKASGARLALVFGGRNTAGRGGTIKRFREHLNTRGARTVALPEPSDTERGQ